jgi:hypothetical protein
VRVPPSLAFRMWEQEKRMVFEHLPLFSVDMSTRWEMNSLRRVNVEEMAAHHDGALAAGVRQANAKATFVDLCNTNAAGIAFQNCRRVIAAFLSLGSRIILEGWRLKARICLFSLLRVSTASLGEGVSPIL